MTRWYMSLAILLGLGLIGLGCAGTYSTEDDDDNQEDDDDDDGDDDDVADDDAGDDDVGDDDVADDDVADDDAGDDDTGGPSCNPFDPVDLPGAQWVYDASYNMPEYNGQLIQDAGTETVSTAGSTYFQGYTVYQRQGMFQGGQYQVSWYGYDNCEGSGSVDYGSFVSDTGGQAAITTVNSTPVLYLPYNPDQQAGYSWNSSYTQTVDLNQDVQSFNVNWNWTIDGVETVSVPAGTFQAVHISADYQSQDHAGSHNGTLDTYWVENLGLVKWDEKRPSEGGQYILRELRSYSGPLNP